MILSFLLFLILIPSASIAADIDVDAIIRAPDPLYNPEGVSNVEARLNEHVGVQLGEASVQLPPRTRVIQTQVPCPECQRAIQEIATNQGDPNIAAASKPPAGAEDEEEEEKENRFGLPNGQSSGASSGNLNGSTFKGTGGSSVSTYGGIPYFKSNADNIDTEIKVDFKPTKTSSDYSGQAGSNVDPVALNQANDTGNSDKGEAFRPRGTGGALPPGAGGSGETYSQNKKKGRAAPDKLGAMAKDMLNKGYHQGKGLQNKDGSLPYKYGSRNGKKNDKRGLASKGLLSPEEILNQRLAEQQARMMNSSLEFGKSNVFIFGAMCSHYVRYAKRYGIPNDRADCPLK